MAGGILWSKLHWYIYVYLFNYLAWIVHIINRIDHYPQIIMRHYPMLDQGWPTVWPTMNNLAPNYIFDLFSSVAKHESISTRGSINNNRYLPKPNLPILKSSLSYSREISGIRCLWTSDTCPHTAYFNHDWINYKTTKPPVLSMENRLL